MATQHGTMHMQSGWAVSFSHFAGIVMVISGIFQALEGLAAVMRQGFFAVTHSSVFYLSVSTWGWINLIVGVIVAAAGFAIFSRRVWGRALGIVLAMLSAIANFFYIPYYPVWSVLIIALDVTVICALSAYSE